MYTCGKNIYVLGLGLTQLRMAPKAAVAIKTIVKSTAATPASSGRVDVSITTGKGKGKGTQLLMYPLPDGVSEAVIEPAYDDTFYDNTVQISWQNPNGATFSVTAGAKVINGHQTGSITVEIDD